MVKVVFPVGELTSRAAHALSEKHTTKFCTSFGSSSHNGRRDRHALVRADYLRARFLRAGFGRSGTTALFGTLMMVFISFLKRSNTQCLPAFRD
jgi:hypothetical protein